MSLRGKRATVHRPSSGLQARLENVGSRLLLPSHYNAATNRMRAISSGGTGATRFRASVAIACAMREKLQRRRSRVVPCPQENIHSIGYRCRKVRATFRVCTWSNPRAGWFQHRENWNEPWRGMLPLGQDGAKRWSMNRPKGKPDRDVKPSPPTEVEVEAASLARPPDPGELLQPFDEAIKHRFGQMISAAVQKSAKSRRAPKKKKPR